MTLKVFPQIPHVRSRSPYLPGQFFETKSGTKLPVREMTMPQDGNKLPVPQGIYRQNYPYNPNHPNRSQWVVTIDGVDFYAKDGSENPAASLVTACAILYKFHGAPKFILQAKKDLLKKERSDKNINTGIPGLQVKLNIRSDNKVVTGFVATNILERRVFTPSINFDANNKASVQKAFDQIMTLRLNAQSHGLTQVEDVKALHKSIMGGMMPTISHKLPEDLLEQIHENRKMKLALKNGPGWNDPRNGRFIKGPR